MYSKNTFGSFYPTKSTIHSLNPLVKLINFFLFLLVIISTSDLRVNILVLSLVSLMIFLSKVPFKFYFNMVYALRYIFIILIIIFACCSLSLELSLVLILKLIMIILYISLITFTTSTSELNYGIEKILKPFNLFNINIAPVSIFITNSIKFIPLLVETGYKALKSQASRGIDYNNSSILGKIYAIGNIFSNLIYLSNRKMKQIKQVSELRMFNVNKVRTNLRTNSFGFNDVFYLAFHILIIFASILQRGLIGL